MKWFRITSTAWQLAIFVALVTLLVWDSTPVPGPDGRVVCEVYEFPFVYLIRYQEVSIYQTKPENVSAYDWFSQQSPLVSHALLVREIPNEPNKPLQWLIAHAPFVKDMLPRKYRYTLEGGSVMVVSLTLEEWKRLRDARRDNTAPLSYLLHM